jgi:DNA helicase-2/ATP-dependent DNA helicase PcrA
LTSEAQWVVNKIQKIASLKNHGDIEGELNSEKIVVLARNKYLFKSLEKALQAANINNQVNNRFLIVIMNTCYDSR